mgnify:CR=1 FL=1
MESLSARKLQLIRTIADAADEWAIEEWEKTTSRILAIQRYETTLVGHRPNGRSVMLSDVIKNGLHALTTLEQEAGWTIGRLERESETW